MANTDQTLELEQANYLIRHVDFGSDSNTPSSKFEIDFSCRDYAQARAIFDLVVSRTKYKPSKLVLSCQHPLHLSHLTALSYEDALPSVFGSRSTGFPKDAPGSGVRDVLVERFKNQSVMVHRGRTRGSKGTLTGYGYVAVIPASAKRVFLFHKDKSAIGRTTAVKREVVLEVSIGPDSKWYSGKYVEILESQTESNNSVNAFLNGIIKMLKQYIVDCPYCLNVGMYQSGDCYIEKLVTGVDVESSCIRCHSSFLVTSLD